MPRSTTPGSTYADQLTAVELCGETPLRLVNVSERTLCVGSAHKLQPQNPGVRLASVLLARLIFVRF
jgi:hypothetical protein